MIQELPNEARTEHLAIVMVLLAISDKGKAKINIENLMKETRITNRKRFFIYIKDLESWNIITRNDGFYWLQNVTMKESYRLQNVTGLKDIKETDRLQTVTNIKDSYRLQNVTAKGAKRLQNVTGQNAESHPVDNSATNSNSKSCIEENLTPHARTSHRRTRAGTELVNLLTLKEEKRGLGKKEEKQKTFAQSEIADFEAFKAAFSTPEYARYNLRDYHNKMKYWKDENGQPTTSNNWTATARTLLRKDWHKVNQQPQPKYR